MPANCITVLDAMSRRKNPESAIQRAVVQHLKARGMPGLIFWHTPQGAFYGSKAQGAIMKGMGVLPGVADLLLFHEGRLYALELKAEGGRASESQLAFLSNIDRAGAYTAMPTGLNAALATLEAWGLLKPDITMKTILQGLETA